MTTLNIIPNINSYTGKIQDSPVSLPANADGQIWTVNGTGFGTKLQQTPQIWEQFKGGVVGESLAAYDTNWLTYQSYGNEITDINPRYTGSLSAASNVFTHGAGFPISTHGFTPSRKVYMSYWYRVTNYTDGKDGGVIKLARLNPDVNGFRYNSRGTTLGGSVGSGYATVDALSGVNNTGYDFPYANNKWIRVEQEIYLSDPLTNNGYLKTTTEEIYTANLLGIENHQEYLIGCINLSMEIANVRKFHYINSVLANTTYSVTYNGNTYNIDSGNSPTISSILNALKLEVDTAAGSGSMIIYGNEIAGWGGYTSVFDSKFTLITNYPLVHATDIYIDSGDVGRFIIGNNANYNACTIREPQPYIQWNDTSVKFKVHAPTITGDKHLFFISDAGTVTYKGRMLDSGALA